jgi:hypothetical protein
VGKLLGRKTAALNPIDPRFYHPGERRRQRLELRQVAAADLRQNSAP